MFCCFIRTVPEFDRVAAVRKMLREDVDNRRGLFDLLRAYSASDHTHVFYGYRWDLASCGTGI